jgi:hypothetical protein
LPGECIQVLADHHDMVDAQNRHAIASPFSADYSILDSPVRSLENGREMTILADGCRGPCW